MIAPGNVRSEPESIMHASVLDLGPPGASSTDGHSGLDFEEELEAAIERRKLQELESSFGGPLYEIPVVVTAIWRLDA